MDLNHLDGYAVSYSHDGHEAEKIQRAVNRMLIALDMGRGLECEIVKDGTGYFIELAVRSDQ